MVRGTPSAPDPSPKPQSAKVPDLVTSDAELAARARLGDALRAAAEGDEDGWRLVVEHFAPRVFGLLKAQCRDSELAEEITQSTLCTVASRIGEYVEQGKFESWLFRIAINRLRDEQRRRGRHAAPAEHAALDLAAGAGPATRSGDTGVPEDTRRALQEAVAKLAPADQRVVHLRHCAGLSFKQIAEALDEPLGTVLARHHRAVRKLRDLFGSSEPER